MKSFEVRAEGLEPTHLAALDPKSSVSTNFTTPANFRTANIINSQFQQTKINYFICFFNRNP